MKTNVLKTALYLLLLPIVLTSCVNFEEDVLNTPNNNKTATRGGDITPYFYYYGGKKQYLELDTERMFVSVSGKSKTSEFISDVTKTRSILMDASKRSNNKNLWTTISFDSKLSEEAYLSKLTELKASRKDIIIAPYFKNEHQDKIGLSNFFYVKLKQESDITLLEQEAAKVNAVIDHQNEFMPLWYILSVTENSEFNAMELSNRFYESGLFQYAEPDLMAETELCSVDEYFSEQWGLKNTGQDGGTPGADINVEQAWQISTGHNVIVAIVDEGIDLEHPDLAANIHPQSFDSERGTPGNPVPQRIEGDHGTLVAGIIGAVRNNGIGIAGVAPDCKLMSVSNTIAHTMLSYEGRA